MLPLAAEKTPDSPAALAAALTAGFAARGVKVQTVRVEGAGLEALQLLSVDLTGAQVPQDFRLPSPDAGGAAVVRAELLEVRGAPLDFAGTPVRIEVRAEDARCRFAGAPGAELLVLVGAAEGRVSVAAGLGDLEALLRRLATDAAAKQGVEIKRTKLEFTARGPQALSFRCTVTAKLFVMSADLTLSGELAVDEQLNARVSGLKLGGDAMVTKLAAGFVRPQLDRLEGRVIPLGALAPAGLPLRSVEIRTADGLEIRAQFGGA